MSIWCGAYKHHPMNCCHYNVTECITDQCEKERMGSLACSILNATPNIAGLTVEWVEHKTKGQQFINGAVKQNLSLSENISLHKRAK
jgi:hypothetical protein